MLSRAHRLFPPQARADTLRLARRAGTPLPTMTPVILGASLLGVVAAFWAYLHTMYGVGCESARFRGVAWAFGAEPWQKLDVRIASAQQADPGPVAAYAFGCLLTLLVATMRARFVWWPFHPAGYIVAGSFGLFHLWLPILVSWLAKVIILRDGGLRGYRRALPFFLGRILDRKSVV